LLERAFATAASYGARLTILHAWFLGTAYDEVINSRTPIEQWAKIAHQRVVDLATALCDRYPQVSVRIDVRHQSAADAIVAAARHSDLVLVGRRHRKHGEHLGPVARAVITASRVPVMVVPSTALVAAEAAAQLDDEADDPVEADRSAGGRSA
jgi:nucleotide-binding universal stress UspA family protein